MHNSSYVCRTAPLLTHATMARAGPARGRRLVSKLRISRSSSDIGVKVLPVSEVERYFLILVVCD